MRSVHVGAVLVAAVVGGCGGDSNGGSDNASRYSGAEADVASVVDAFATAGNEGDGQRICTDVFALPLAKNVERKSKQSCAGEIEDNLPKGEYELDIDQIQVRGSTATATVTDQDGNSSVFSFVKDGSDWRVLRITGAQ
jgi:hypothetical protein